jgi:hypothetical protein
MMNSGVNLGAERVDQFICRLAGAGISLSLTPRLGDVAPRCRSAIER